MEQVIDKIIEILNTFTTTTAANGGCSNVLQVEAIYFGDPGIIPAQLYHCITVDPVMDTPVSENTGYEIRDHEVQITLLVDSREYFDAGVDEASGDRKMVTVMQALRSYLRQTHNRTLGGLSGVREVVVSETDYMVQVRGSVIAKSARITLAVNKQYSRVA